MDILYSTMANFLEQKDELGSIEYNIWRDGVVIYAKETGNIAR